MSVRHAHLTDIPRLLALARREHEASAWARMPFDAASCEAQMRAFIEGIGRTAFASEGGYLFGLVQPAGFSAARIALEFAWYAEDGQGLLLLGAFEAWAQRMGAYAVVVHAYGAADHLGSILQRRRGYQPLGAAFTKQLEH